MKKTFIALSVVMLCVVASAGWSADEPVSLTNEIVVDRTTRNKVLTDYVLLTRNAIQRAWTTPVALKSDRAVKGRVRINYAIKRDGVLDSVKLVNGSGNPAMDRSLMEAIRAAQPYPVFPDPVQANRMLIRANFIVADLPTAAVTTTSQPIPKQKPSLVETEVTKRSAKQFTWGKPAGSANDDAQAEKAEPTAKRKADPNPPHNTKFKWGSR